MKKLFFLLLVMGMVGSVFSAMAQETGDQVVLVYNTRVPESKSVAEYYAWKRNVPKAQIMGFDLPENEDINRHDFREKLQKPLLKALESKGLFHFEAQTIPETNDQPRRVIRKVTKAKIRYLALCYGVPLRINNDPSLHEQGQKMRPELQRNGAAVDSELACLTTLDQYMLLAGPLPNRWFACTNSQLLNPTNDILMVTRLDGPTAAIARSLVDKAMDAETNGLWGRAYFDLRGLTNGEYKLGDDWIYAASEICRSVGYDTIVDSNGGTFAASFPMSQTAFYAGWYDEHASGPFARGTVEFMPGAFAYHLHSFSAATLRSTTKQWVGPLLARGATATMGCVDEPFLAGTPNIAMFFARFIYAGYTFGEAAYACQNYVSWQTTVVGDPLYRPFARAEGKLRQDLLKRQSKLLEWDYVILINKSLLRKVPLDKIIAATEGVDIIKTSPVLQEKLAELYTEAGKPSSSVFALQQVLKLDSTPQQRVRVMLLLANHLISLGREPEAYAVYQQFLKEFPNYPDPTAIYRPLYDLAQKLGHKEEAAQYQSQINRMN